ncbi:hypothetical protein G6F37_006850 [Rhizopus arrhizus]|nr:hypothetical protein G6F37_006850 [Rhizopus arrhizus]
MLQTPSSSSTTNYINEETISNPTYGSLNTLSQSNLTTTASPDDNEGLYLLWTHQLLRERGFIPSPCLLNDEEEDDDSISSLSEDEEEQRQILFYPQTISSYEPIYSYQTSMASHHSITQDHPPQEEQPCPNHFYQLILKCFGK